LFSRNNSEKDQLMKPLPTLSVLLLLAATAAYAQRAPAHKKHAAHTQTAPAAPKVQAVFSSAAAQTPPRTAPIMHDGPFPDVPKDHWAFQSVETLRTTRIMRGYPAATPAAK